jgi:hypothetical protein
MKASIHSYDTIKKEFGKGTRGKTLTVSSSQPCIEPGAGFLTVTAYDCDYYYPRDDFGLTPPREIERTLTLELSSADIKLILEAALATKLIDVSFVVRTH